MPDITPSKRGRLILTRRPQQSIIIGQEEDNVRITVGKICLDRQLVQLIVEGPEDVPINRSEIAIKKGLIR